MNIYIYIYDRRTFLRFKDGENMVYDRHVLARMALPLLISCELSLSLGLYLIFHPNFPCHFALGKSQSMLLQVQYNV
jgi:hypothetical protein